ncbi:PadR family transcriptional regulator [Bacillus sp. 31A1R]|uniref:PadR family transcriptional regulator n=1 Tax=Robertmurraya mangrovi TaxID=3098077 RepID=A0ABU5ITW4_9BACI|nr:PadR family transcriptional regulator [Bacillus sp. 31A1R]MDZ5470589.1 PadR family transcriptional regulator [Bacillus sp. 31A1R]
MSIEHSILAVLSFGPSSGYDIKSEFEHEASGLFWGASYGSIYPKLKKLEETGYIFALEEEDEGRKKKLYELTKKGWLELEQWLGETPSYPIIKDELFMKMGSWHRDMDLKILVNHLLERKKQSEHLLRFVTEWPKNGVSYIDQVGMLAIQYAKMRLETELLWIDRTIEMIQSGDLPKAQDTRGNAEKMITRRRKTLQE